MKIAHVIPALTKGGAEKVVVDLANAAVESGHQVVIIAAMPAPLHLLADRLSREVRLVYVGGSLRSSYLRLPLWLFRKRSWLFGFDVVHCHLTFGSVFALELQGMRWLFSRRRPAVVETYHAVGMAIPPRVRTLHAILLSRRDAVAFMADDPYWAQFRDRRPRTIFKTIPNGIAEPVSASPEGRDAYRKGAEAIPLDARIVGTVSRLVPARRPDLLLEAFGHVARASGTGVHMLIAGEGSERLVLERMARELGIASQVHMPGLAIQPADPMSLMDLFVTVNVGSITGIAALEAAFLGVPVIAIQLQQGYVADSEDWIWSSTNAVEVGKRAIELLNDRAALCDLAIRQQGIARALFSVDAMKEAYDGFYSAALSGRDVQGNTACR